MLDTMYISATYSTYHRRVFVYVCVFVSLILQRYLTALRKEKEAFQHLIKQKAVSLQEIEYSMFPL